MPELPEVRHLERVLSILRVKTTSFLCFLFPRNWRFFPKNRASRALRALGEISRIELLVEGFYCREINKEITMTLNGLAHISHNF